MIVFRLLQEQYGLTRGSLFFNKKSTLVNVSYENQYGQVIAFKLLMGSKHQKPYFEIKEAHNERLHVLLFKVTKLY